MIWAHYNKWRNNKWHLDCMQCLLNCSKMNHVLFSYVVFFIMNFKIVQISFQPNFHIEYNWLAHQFHPRTLMLIFIKHIFTMSTNIIKYQPNPTTIFALMVDESTIHYLTFMHGIHNGNVAPHVQLQLYIFYIIHCKEMKVISLFMKTLY